MTTDKIQYLSAYLSETIHDKEVHFYGTLRKARTGKKFSFLEVGYGKHQVQVVTSTSELPTITIGSYLSVKGKVQKLPPGVYSSLPLEVVGATITVVSLADEKTTMYCPPQSSSEVRLAQRLHHFRDQSFASKLRLSDILCQAFRAYFMYTDCTEILPPSFTGVECEGGATLFKVEHPGKSTDKPMSAYLTQSSQFALEYALPGVGDCFCIAPSFRAEHSHTRRHLTEFTHVEAEWGGIISFDDHLAKLRHLIRGVLERFLVFGEWDLKALGKYERVTSLLDASKDILILTHKDAILKCREMEIYKDPATKTHFSSRDDIPEAQERELIDRIGKIVFLVKFPKEFKSFYMGLDPEDPSYVLGCDVEVPGVGEIIGSGVRESSAERLTERLLEAKLQSADYEEYIALRKCGFCMTSGMGLGLGRMLCWLLEEYSIRDVTAFPRFPGYLRP
jgi:asparaginyl-tRNA synthetase